MEFTSTEGADSAPAGYMPWFEVPGRKTADTVMVFGHWSTLATGTQDRQGAQRVAVMRRNTLALDTGCVWGGCLSAARLGAAPGTFELIQVQCEQAPSD